MVITDVWTSMGQEEERQKREATFAGYCVDEQLMAQAKPDAMVQHCLPAHRGEEITEEVFEANAQYIFEEAENRLHAQKAVLVKPWAARARRVKRKRLSGQREAACRLIKSRCAAFCFGRRRSPFHSRIVGV